MKQWKLTRGDRSDDNEPDVIGYITSERVDVKVEGIITRARAQERRRQVSRRRQIVQELRLAADVVKELEAEIEHLTNRSPLQTEDLARWELIIREELPPRRNPQ